MPGTASVLWIYQLGTFCHGNKQGGKRAEGGRGEAENKYSKFYGLLEGDKYYEKKLKVEKGKGAV